MCFAGRFVASNPAVAASSYGQKALYALNYDTFGGSLVCALYLLVLNDWPMVMDAAEAATGKGSRLYFILFWVVHIVVILNVVVAFVVETYGIQKEKRETARRSGAGSGSAAAAQCVEDWGGLLRASGADFSGYRVSRKLHHSDILDDVYRAELRGRFADTFSTALS